MPLCLFGLSTFIGKGADVLCVNVFCNCKNLFKQHLPKTKNLSYSVSYM